MPPLLQTSAAVFFLFVQGVLPCNMLDVMLSWCCQPQAATVNLQLVEKSVFCFSEKKTKYVQNYIVSPSFCFTNSLFVLYFLCFVLPAARTFRGCK